MDAEGDFLVQLHKSRDAHAECMRKMFGAKNIDKVQQSVASPSQLTVDEFCCLHDQFRQGRTTPERHYYSSSRPPSSGRKPAKLHFFEDSETAPVSPEHQMMAIDRFSSCSIQTTPTSSPAHDLAAAHGDSQNSGIADACGVNLSSSSTDSSHSYAAFSSSSNSRQPVVAIRNATIEKMILDNSRNQSPKLCKSMAGTPVHAALASIPMENAQAVPEGMNESHSHLPPPLSLPPTSSLASSSSAPLTSTALLHLARATIHPLACLLSEPMPPATLSLPSAHTHLSAVGGATNGCAGISVTAPLPASTRFMDTYPVATYRPSRSRTPVPRMSAQDLQARHVETMLKVAQVTMA